jgi:dTDP-4-amino-4,6-dideoxygalactose transaminase
VSNNEIDIDTWNISWPQPKDVKTPVASTSITMIEKKYVNEAIDSNWIGPGGRFNLLCEKFLSENTLVGHEVHYL